MAYEYDVFISYRRDPDPKEWTQKIFLPKFQSFLREELGKKDLKIFIDEQGIEGGQYWEDTLKLALARSKCLVPILMTSYFQSQWCVREFSVMLHRQEQLVAKPKGLIVPFVIYDGDYFPPPLSGIQSFDCKAFYFTGKGFEDSQRFLDFQIALKNYIGAVANAVRAAPAWDSEWLNNQWLEVPTNHLLLNDDLTIPQPLIV